MGCLYVSLLKNSAPGLIVKRSDESRMTFTVFHCNDYSLDASHTQIAILVLLLQLNLDLKHLISVL